MSIVSIKVNGKALSADTEKNLLENLKAAGIEIPNLCYCEELECYGGCGLCVAELEGAGRLIRTCAVFPKEGMALLTNSESVERTRKITLSLLLSDHTGDCRPPCRMACPTHQDCRGYIELIGKGDNAGALKLIKKDNPLPASIGRVCPHPCEDKCRRGLLESPVAICSLKRFAADSVGTALPVELAASTGKSVAVVGAGPAGLSAAYFLRLAGHSVEVFEAQDKAGGMLRYGIPEYRLPKAVLDAEIASIEAMGVKFNYGKRLGADITLEGLKKSHDAVFIALGAWKSSSLGCEGDSLPGVLGGIDFLYDVANGKKVDIGDKVAVIGGGNTAIDAVRTAVRLGAKEVSLLYRRTKAEMPAEDIEILEAEEEGVNFVFLSAPLSVIEKNGKAVGLRVQKMQLGEPDASGRRKPVAIEGAVEDIAFDTIISAIGQKVVTDGAESLEKTRWGTLIADKHSFLTSVEGVFAGGDAVNDGPGIAVTAISHGKEAAAAIDLYLNGKKLPTHGEFFVTNDSFTKEDIGEVEELCRTEMKNLPAEDRKHSFVPVALGFTEEDAKREASRCLKCGCDFLDDCRFLPLINEYKAYEITYNGKKRHEIKDFSHPTIIRDNNKCILCGQCVRVCREKEHIEALGFFGRGFESSARCAYNIGLAQSVCNSCGECARLCPTGAITFASGK